MRILIVRCGALGDLVASTSVIEAMKLQFGEDTLINFVSTPSASALFAQDKRVNKIFHLQHKKIPYYLSRQKQAIVKASKQEPYDLLINFERGKQFKSLVSKIVAIKKVGHFFTPQITKKDHLHSVEVKKSMYQDVVSADVFNKSFPRLLGTDTQSIQNKYKLNNKYLIISPSNSHQKRNKLNYRAWQNDKWKKLIVTLSKKIHIVIIGNKGEDAFFNDLLPYPPNVTDLVGKTPLSDLITVVQRAQGLIATDTGTAHIASAVNTEVFALIGPTPAHQTGPFKTPNNIVHIISANLECSPCYRTQAMKECTDNICMKEISVAQVVDTVLPTIS